MSKSKGNFYRLEDIVDQGFSPMDLRMLFLSAHYRSQMNFTWEGLMQAKKNKEAFFKTLQRVRAATVSPSGFSAASFLERCIAAWEDDLNTPLALAVVAELLREVNAHLDASGPLCSDVLSAFETIATVFGVRPEEISEIPEAITALALAREEARVRKDFLEADRLRDEIISKGYVVEDTPSGPKVTKI